MAILEEPQKSTVTLVGDLTKQLITLSSAFLTVTVTFSKDLLDLVGEPWLVRSSWICFIISVVAGILAMMTLTGRVQRLTGDLAFDGSLRAFSLIQVAGFALALIAVFVAGLFAIGG